MTSIVIKRVYDNKEADGTYRILIDRLWPRGIKKTDLQFDEWNKEITPSSELRKWFAHKEAHFEVFAKLYVEELNTKKEEIKRLKYIAQEYSITLLYAAKNPMINHAIILKNYLLEKDDKERN